MAKMINSGMDDVLNLYKDLDFQCPAIFDRAVEETADMVIEPVKAASRAVFTDTSELDKHIKATKVYRTAHGVVSVKIQYAGYLYGNKKKPVPLIINAREFGSKRGEVKRPFIRPTVTKLKTSVEKRMQAIVDEEVGKIAKQ